MRWDPQPNTLAMLQLPFVALAILAGAQGGRAGMTVAMLLYAALVLLASWAVGRRTDRRMAAAARRRGWTFQREDRRTLPFRAGGLATLRATSPGLAIRIVTGEHRGLRFQAFTYRYTVSRLFPYRGLPCVAAVVLAEAPAPAPSSPGSGPLRLRDGWTLEPCDGELAFVRRGRLRIPDILPVLEMAETLRAPPPAPAAASAPRRRQQRRP